MHQTGTLIHTHYIIALEYQVWFLLFYDEKVDIMLLFFQVLLLKRYKSLRISILDIRLAAANGSEPLRCVTFRVLRNTISFGTTMAVVRIFGCPGFVSRMSHSESPVPLFSEIISSSASAASGSMCGYFIIFQNFQIRSYRMLVVWPMDGRQHSSQYLLPI